MCKRNKMYMANVEIKGHKFNLIYRSLHNANSFDNKWDAILELYNFFDDALSTIEISDIKNVFMIPSVYETGIYKRKLTVG